MQTPTYQIRKIGDRYVAVLTDNRTVMRRAAYVGGGGFVALIGLQRRGLVGAIATVTGVAFILKGAFGRNRMKSVENASHRGGTDGAPNQGPSYQNEQNGRAAQSPGDVVEEQSMESFPASDAPGRTGTFL